MPASPWAHALAVVSSVVVVTASSPASATVVKAMSLLEKVEQSPVVLHGIVERIETRWVVPGQNVETLVTINVVESIKGGQEPGSRVTFRRGGGRIGDFEMTAPGLSEYEPGEEIIMFLEPLGATLVAIGIGIGKYTIERRGEGKFVTHDPDVAVVRYADQTPIGVRPHTAMQPEALPDFLKRLRSYARGFKKGPTLDPNTGVYEKPNPTLKNR